MVGIDTNILVRFFAQDDPDQARQVDVLMESLSAESPGFIASVVLAELAWVLRKNYRIEKARFIEYIEHLLGSPEIVLENEAALKQVQLRMGSTNADFADCLIERICANAGCTQTLTFDANSVRHSGMTLLQS
jgi:predicted nucleic-acid-binding protein